MNRLKDASSPYLQQHANNPVDWYPWTNEALEKAKSEDKPILVSIGYSTCHWCHVMEQESFENQEVADYMNALFVCIKVDREERPDLDAIYMDACQIIAGTAGWPLNIFLTPDLKPFHGGTYFPPESRSGMPSWMETLNFVAYNFYENRAAVEAQADKILARIKGGDDQFLMMQPASAKKDLNDAFFFGILDKILGNADRKNGGFGQAPKFPNLMTLSFLQRMDYYYGNPEAKAHLDFSLRKMLNGGIYDQIGGGIARYATDVAWLVPHFEKMLYDNALLVILLAQKYKQDKSPFILRKLEQTLDFIIREMTDANGGFYAALDADSDGEEGRFYTWSKKEFDTVLGKDAPLFAKYWHVSKSGNWEGKNILWNSKENDDKAFLAKADAASAKLLTYRNKRVRPHRDEKILLNWNALLCKAFVLAYQATGAKKYKNIAQKQMTFLLDNFQKKDGHLFHVYMKGNSSIDGLSTDYALLIDALLSVYELDFDRHYLNKAAALTEIVLKEFYDPKTHLFFATAKHQKDVVVRKKEIYDAEIPSTNAVMISNLHRLGLLLDKSDYTVLAEKMIKLSKGALEKHPMSFPAWLNSSLAVHQGLVEYAIIGQNAPQKAQQLLSHYIPDRIVVASTHEDDTMPLLKGKSAEKDALIYVCRNYTCSRPTKEVNIRNFPHT